MYCTYNVTLTHIPATIVAQWKSNITYSECVFAALGIQRAMRKHRILLPSVGCPALQYFPRYLLNGTIFERKKKLPNIKVCFDILYKFRLKHFSL